MPHPPQVPWPSGAFPSRSQERDGDGEPVTDRGSQRALQAQGSTLWFPLGGLGEWTGPESLSVWSFSNAQSKATGSVTSQACPAKAPEPPILHSGASNAEGGRMLSSSAWGQVGWVERGQPQAYTGHTRASGRWAVSEMGLLRPAHKTQMTDPQDMIRSSLVSLAIKGYPDAEPGDSLSPRGNQTPAIPSPAAPSGPPSQGAGAPSARRVPPHEAALPTGHPLSLHSKGPGPRSFCHASAPSGGWRSTTSTCPWKRTFPNTRHVQKFFVF